MSQDMVHRGPDSPTTGWRTTTRFPCNPRLLSEPGGFEGLLALGEDSQGHNRAVSDRPQVANPDLDLGAAALGPQPELEEEPRVGRRVRRTPLAPRSPPHMVERSPPSTPDLPHAPGRFRRRVPGRGRHFGVPCKVAIHRIQSPRLNAS